MLFNFIDFPQNTHMKKTSTDNKFAIIYLAYGLESTKYQAIISIYTLYHHVGADNKDFLFFIYTDNKTNIFDKYLAGLPVTIEVLTKEQIKSFRGPNDYVFRIKPCIIKDYFSKNNFNALYMDTDTFFLRNPIDLLNKIEPGVSIMNTQEHNFIDGGQKEYLHWFALRQALKQHTYSIQGEQTSIPLSTMMWNAGIIGISHKNSNLFNDIISLTDEMYSKFSTFIVEQFAASYILQKFTTLQSTEDYINHYWLKDVKNSFNERIPIFLKSNNSKSGQSLYGSAFEFAKETSSIFTSYQQPLLDRITTRLRLIAKVMKQGHI